VLSEIGMDFNHPEAHAAAEAAGAEIDGRARALDRR